MILSRHICACACVCVCECNLKKRAKHLPRRFDPNKKFGLDRGAVRTEGKMPSRRFRSAERSTTNKEYADLSFLFFSSHIDISLLSRNQQLSQHNEFLGRGPTSIAPAPNTDTHTKTYNARCCRSNGGPPRGEGGTDTPASPTNRSITHDDPYE